MSSDWKIPHNVTLIASGMFVWDYSTTLWLEFKLVRGKMKLQWPLIPYFLTRYTSLGFVIGCLVFETSRWPIDCNALYIGGNLLGKVAVASASANLVVRTVVIWLHRRYTLLLLLGALITGEVVLICIGLRDQPSVTWSYEFQYCIGSSVSPESNLGLFAPYALFVDCIIVTLTIVGLQKYEPTKGLANVLIRQGLCFFLLALFFQTFVTAAVFTDSHNNVLISVSSTLCAIIVPMVSCHLVRSVLEISYSSPGVCGSSGDLFTSHVESGRSLPSTPTFYNHSDPDKLSAHSDTV